MIQTLENALMKVEVSDQGAELQSIFNKQNQIEYLWQGEASVWPRKAPVLFPIVGKVKDNTYIFNQQAYSLPQHGFARDRAFKLIASTSTSCTYRLTSSDETIYIYPFAFELDIIYSIDDARLNVAYRIHNPSDQKELYFSIGAHPGFRCPLVEGEKFEDYYLEFEKAEKLNRILLDGGLRGDETEAVALTNNKLPLTVDLFGPKDAIVVSGLNSERISLKSTKSAHGLHFNYKNYPWFGIWSKPGPFVCLEPWMGVADDIHSTGDFTKKESIQKLKPESEVQYSYSMELF
ncbi:aldose 1-epimerase family protein [Cytophaga aurantiaca]|uniref:aldose 1-epimerase family protein n=1 Tax=Cytophaga aurantiaca TaxID=29530 RepID=UPI0003A04039|nr:aldose 1-epimerase family protein [Cytophaga aurantiaca]